MPKSDPKYALCPHCGYQNMKPDGTCIQCIPPEFRAETARAFMKVLIRNIGNGSDIEAKESAYFQVHALAVAFADALIAALRKPPAGHDPYAAKE